MGLESVDSIFAKLVDYLEVARERVRMLIVFGRYVRFDCIGEAEGVRPAEGYLQDITALHIELWTLDDQVRDPAARLLLHGSFVVFI